MQVIPAADGAGAYHLLCHILADVVADGGILASKLLRGGKAKLPIRNVVDGLAILPVSLAAVRELYSFRVDKPMEMDCAVLVIFRNDEIPEPFSSDPVIQPLGELPGSGLVIVPIYLIRRQRKRDESVEVVTGGKVEDLPLGPVRRPPPGSGVPGFQTVVHGRRHFFCLPEFRAGQWFLPARLAPAVLDRRHSAENRARRNDAFHDFPRAGIDFHAAIAVYFIVGKRCQWIHFDGILCLLSSIGTAAHRKSDKEDCPSIWRRSSLAPLRGGRTAARRCAVAALRLTALIGMRAHSMRPSGRRPPWRPPPGRPSGPAGARGFPAQGPPVACRPLAPPSG